MGLKAVIVADLILRKVIETPSQRRKKNTCAPRRDRSMPRKGRQNPPTNSRADQRKRSRVR